jgi:hypothetical protein
MTLCQKPGVYFAPVDDQGKGVIMDLDGNRYYGLGPLSASLWTGLHDGCSEADLAERLGEHTTAPFSERLTLVTRQLEAWQRAQLVVSPDAARAISAPAAAIPANASSTEQGLDDAELCCASLSLRSSVALLAASLWTRAQLRRGALHAVRQLQGIAVLPTPPDTHERVVHRTVYAYRLLRKWLLRGIEKDLPRSLVLACALRRQRVPVELCFGVRKFPFLAHAWVELDGRSINTCPATLRQIAIIARFG